jgi:hypothetical protein
MPEIRVAHLGREYRDEALRQIIKGSVSWALKLMTSQVSVLILDERCPDPSDPVIVTVHGLFNRPEELKEKLRSQLGEAVAAFLKELNIPFRLEVWIESEVSKEECWSFAYIRDGE